MQDRIKSSTARHSAVAGRAAWVFCVSAALIASCAAPVASAAPTPAQAQSVSIPQSQPADAGPPTLINPPQRQPLGVAVKQNPGQTPPTTAPAPQPKSGCGDKSAAGEPKPSPEGPQPLYVCKQSKITAEPVWRGEAIDFVFEISNAGEGDLQIKIKGG